MSAPCSVRQGRLMQTCCSTGFRGIVHSGVRTVAIVCVVHPQACTRQGSNWIS